MARDSLPAGSPAVEPLPTARRYHDYNGFSLSWERTVPGVYWHQTDRVLVAAVLRPARIRIDVGNNPAENRASGHYECAGKHVSIVSAGTDYVSQWRDEGEILRWFIHPVIVDRVAYDCGRRGSVEIADRYMIHDAILEDLSELTCRESKLGLLTKLYAESIITVLVVQLIRHYATDPYPASITARSLDSRRLRKIKEYVEAHLDQDLSLNELAAQAEMSPHYFWELFRNGTGLSPWRYVTYRRIELAKHLIARSDLRLADIALQVGFSSQTRFTESFVRSTGMTPLAYRNPRRLRRPT